MLKKAGVLNRRYNFFGLIIVILLGLGCNPNLNNAAPENMKDYTHKSGLILKLSEKFSASETDNGLLVEPSDGSNKSVRIPVEIKVEFFKDKEIPPLSATEVKEKAISDRKIVYKIEKSEGGSAGETYTFTGYEKVFGGYVKYSQTTQDKYGEPDFSTLWDIIADTSVKK